MKRIISSFLILFACWLQFATAQTAEAIHFNHTYKKVSPTEIEITFKASIDDGWHVYSTNIPKDGPTPTSFNIDKIKGAEVLGKLKVGKGEISKFDPIFNMDVRFFEHECTFTQRIKLTAKTYSIKGYLEYGACNDENCIPPTAVDFEISGNDGPSKAIAPASKKIKKETKEIKKKTPEVVEKKTEVIEKETVKSKSALWTPVIDQLQKFNSSGTTTNERAWWSIFLLGFIGGLVALFTPCVWPIIPMTVSFFMKRSENRKKGIKDAITYGISIVVIYVALGLIITSLFGASALNDLSTNAIFNILFFLMLVVFAASFFGGFEITLPNSWSAAVDSKADKTTGLLSIFLMAFTLSLVSFSCTGPIIGFLLVEVSTTNSIVAPTIGMLGFAIALALPFTIFALFPSMLKSAPRSGQWMNVVKVTLGFIELAFALKFLSVADLAYGWHILDRETFLAIWIVLFALLGMYLLGRLKFPHDSDDNRTTVPRFFLGLCSLAFAVYMLPGLWGAPLKAVSAFAPPMSTQDFNLSTNKVEPKFDDYELGMDYAKKMHKPVMIDFTGHGCVNCRKMELAVWHNHKVSSILNDDYVLISLYVDDKTKLEEPIEIVENGKKRTLRTIGDKWSYLQRSKFGANAQPFYILIDNDGNPINGSYSYDEDVDKYVDFLQQGLKNYKK